ncbi:hypothetical protein TcWFU_001845 [Taenia crassiceps]|uniref:Uncharacterized protein n=1 Tax=Taenia crassiceps TaxID=6207 RepID=A0ABR4QAG8_9CEST
MSVSLTLLLLFIERNSKAPAFTPLSGPPQSSAHFYSFVASNRALERRSHATDPSRAYILIRRHQLIPSHCNTPNHKKDPSSLYVGRRTTDCSSTTKQRHEHHRHHHQVNPNPTTSMSTKQSREWAPLLTPSTPPLRPATLVERQLTLAMANGTVYHLFPSAGESISSPLSTAYFLSVLWIW